MVKSCDAAVSKKRKKLQLLNKANNLPIETVLFSQKNIDLYFLGQLGATSYDMCYEFKSERFMQA